MGQRFDCFPDPIGKWMVWDLHTEWVAQVRRRELIGLSEEEARHMHAVLSGEASPYAETYSASRHLRVVARN